MTTNRIGSNQFQKKSRVTIGGVCVATLLIGVGLHYAFIGMNDLALKILPSKSVISPKPTHGNMFIETAYASESAAVTPTPTTELENIVAYIARVFEPEGKAVVVKAINCFYSESGLRSNAVGHNSDKEKSTDYGVAQLNDYWHKLTPEEKTEYKANIDKAYEIYKGNGHTFNPWYGRLCK